MKSSGFIKLDRGRIRGANFEEPRGRVARQRVPQKSAGDTGMPFGRSYGQVQDFALAGPDLPRDQKPNDAGVNQGHAAFVIEVPGRIPLRCFRRSSLYGGDRGKIPGGRGADGHSAVVHRKRATPNSGITDSAVHTGAKPTRSTTLPIQGERNAVINPKDE